jgi:tRNA threonylcarbamoyladenosine biosynthesis protein TsaE
MNRELRDESETLAVGAYLFECIDEPCILYLRGDLGAGKTTLVRGFLRALGYQGVVKSPTFTLVEEYRLNGWLVYHFDLYRLADPEELEWIGVRDYIQGGGVCFFEWPQRGQGVLPPADVDLQLVVFNESRRFTLTGCSPLGKKIEGKITKLFE